MSVSVLQNIVHYSLHILFPGLVASIFFRRKWKIAWIIMLSTMLVDSDHLLADPIFDPNRCSIGFHILHSHYAIAIYALLFITGNKVIRIIALGLLLHMATDFQDCFWER